MVHIRNRLKALLRPLYQRSPALQRLRHTLQAKRRALRQHYWRGVNSPHNLAALQALSARRFLAHSSPDTRFASPLTWPLIDISVVTYNSAAWVDRFLASLCAQSYPTQRLRLILVDHGSDDDTQVRLTQALAGCAHRFAGVERIAQENRGFGAGHHRALQAGKAAFCLITNIDLEFLPDSITTVVAAALQDDQGQVASWELRQLPYEHPKYYDPVTLETNWSSHACILLRRSAYDAAGGYDPHIFMYAEDVELSYRLRSHGYVLKYIPHACIWHHTYAVPAQVKPRQLTGSTIGNLYIRLRYGERTQQLAGLALYGALLVRPAAFPGARRTLLANLGTLMRHRAHFRQGRGSSPAFYPLRGFDFELRRNGAYHNSRPISPQGALVSVITRSYAGREMFLRQALASLLNQTWRSLQIIVVQDGGESLAPLVREAGDRAGEGREVIFLPHAKEGRSAAGNAGLARATGALLMFLDDDDLLFPDHIETLAHALEDEPGADAAYSLSFEVLTRMTTDGAGYRETAFEQPAVLHQEWDHDVLLDHNFIPIQAILFRRHLYDTHGGFDPALDQLEDWHLWLRYGHGRRFHFVPKTTSLFRSPANDAARRRRAMNLHKAYTTARQSALALFPPTDKARHDP